MKPEIKNGVLFAGGERVVLAHVSGWRVEGNCVILVLPALRLSLNVGSDATGLDAALCVHFMAEQEKRDNPLFAVNLPPPTTSEPMMSLDELEKERAHRAAATDRMKGLR